MPARAGLVAQVVQGRPHHPLAHRPIQRAVGSGDAVAEAQGQGERGPALAPADPEVPQAPEGPELVLEITEALRDLERGRPRRDRVGRRALGLHERHPERGAELHLAARIGRVRTEARPRPLGPVPALDQERLLEPQRHRGHRERHSERRVSTRRERPVERGAEVVDLPAVDREPLAGGAALQLGVGPLEEAPVVLGVAPGGGVELAGLLERIGARGLEETVARDRAHRLDHHQGLGDQVGRAVHHVTAPRPAIVATAVAASMVKPPAKTPSRCSTCRSSGGSRS